MPCLCRRFRGGGVARLRLDAARRVLALYSGRLAKCGKTGLLSRLPRLGKGASLPCVSRRRHGGAPHGAGGGQPVRPGHVLRACAASWSRRGAKRQEVCRGSNSPVCVSWALATRRGVWHVMTLATPGTALGLSGLASYQMLPSMIYMASKILPRASIRLPARRHKGSEPAASPVVTKGPSRQHSPEILPTASARHGWRASTHP